jgi:uncharacterized protein YndB with AHSA1/START domain
MSVTNETALRLSIEVAVSVDRAFEVFTTEFDSIKPREHNMLGEPIAETVLEPTSGGRLYDRGASGATCDWGRVLTFDPPNRLVLAWDISPRWQLETDRNRTSEVEITFTAIDATNTRVDLEHRNLDRHGDGWQGLRAGLEAPEGWPLYLERYAKLLTAS